MQTGSHSCEIDHGLHKFVRDWTCKSSSTAAVKCGCNNWFNFKKRIWICIQSKQILPVLLVFHVIDNYSNHLGYDNRNMKVKSLMFMHHFCGIQREEMHFQSSHFWRTLWVKSLIFVSWVLQNSNGGRWNFPKLLQYFGQHCKWNLLHLWVGTSGISKGGRCKFPEFLEFFTILESTASEIPYLSELGPMEFNGWKMHFS